MKTIGAFVIAAIGGYLIAAVMVSWVNMQSIVDLGFEITFAQRLDTITHDVMSLGMTYLPLMTIALLIGFLVVAGIIRLKPSLAFIGYILAGFAAVVALRRGRTGSIATRHVSFKAAMKAPRLLGFIVPFGDRRAQSDSEKDPSRECACQSLRY